MVIACIFFDGQVSSQEPDEYVEIVNWGGAAQELAGWRLTDIADGGPTFVFPAWTLDPGEAVRVYTDEIHPQWGGFNFGRGTAVWNNSEADTAGLFDKSGVRISTKSYPPGCD